MGFASSHLTANVEPLSVMIPEEPFGRIHCDPLPAILHPVVFEGTLVEQVFQPAILDVPDTAASHGAAALFHNDLPVFHYIDVPSVFTFRAVIPLLGALYLIERITLHLQELFLRAG